MRLSPAFKHIHALPSFTSVEKKSSDRKDLHKMCKLSACVKKVRRNPAESTFFYLSFLTKFALHF